jgi:hypothetical protein
MQAWLLLLLAAAQASTGADPADEERFLRHARIVSVQPIGEGITGASRVVLQDGPKTARAAFKTIDTRLESPYRFGAEAVDTYRDSYRHELAAYALDKLLGFRLVPPVVERKIEGRKGSLQVWVERTLTRFAPASPPADARRANEAVHAMRLFDYLIFNPDRHPRNVVFDPTWRPVAIDHSLAFPAFVRPYRPLYRFPRGPVERLRHLDARALDQALRPHLGKDQRAGLRTRRRRALEQVDAAIAAQGDEATLFDW